MDELRLMKIADIAALLGCSVDRAYRVVARPEFPMKIKLGRKSLGWNEQTVMVWWQEYRDCTPEDLTANSYQEDKKRHRGRRRHNGEAVAWLSDIAKLLRVAPGTAWRRTQEPGFPPPLTTTRRKWLLADVTAWMNGRRWPSTTDTNTNGESDAPN